MANSCTTKKVIITESDLPLSCPMTDQDTINTHPRVYLPIETTKHEICKYCSTEYILEEKT